MSQPELSQEDLLRRITNRIRQSLELEEILTATVAELRSLLGTDRVIVYQFHASGSGEVMAESIQDNCLPSLKGLNFPADDIPETARQKYMEKRLCSFVDVGLGRIGWLPIDCCITSEETIPLEELVEYHPVDSCHAAYLTAMGVQSTVVLPIVHNNIQSEHAKEQLWGLLVCHSIQLRVISRRELQVMQWAIDQVSIAIAQSHLLAKTRQQHFVEATTNRVATLLHSLPTIELSAALEETVTALQGCGGRLYIAPYTTDDRAEVLTCGTQLAPLIGETESLIEQHPVFTAWTSCLEENTLFLRERREPEENSSSQPGNPPIDSSPTPTPKGVPFFPSCSPLTVTNLYSLPDWRTLTPAFQFTTIRGILVMPLYYRSSFLGYLSIFRPEIDTETLWAGRFDPSEKQRLPRQSFEVWRELKRGQAKEWTRQDIELAVALGHQFAMAIEQYELYSLVQSLNANLERQVEERTAKLQQALEQGRALERVTSQIRSTLDLNTILQTIVREVRSLLDTDRVVIYQFADNAQGKVIVESINGDWFSTLGASDPHGYFLETQSQPYKRGRVRVISDVARAPLAPAQREFLQRFHIQATLIVPIGMGAYHSQDIFSCGCTPTSLHKNQEEQPLWGFLIAQECHAPRSWQAFEIDLLQQLADQAAVAIQQAELYDKSRTAAATATAQAKQLAIVAQQQQALFGVITKIRESLDVKAIFKATTTEVRRLLAADRVAVFRFAPEFGYDHGEVVSEDIQPGLPEANRNIQDYCFGEKYRSGWIQAIPDIYNAGLNDCHIKILEQLHVRSTLMVPLPKGDTLWGLLCIYQCTGLRYWDTSEIDFVRQVAVHLGIALQQAGLLEDKEQQAAEIAFTLENLKQAQTQLIQTEKMSSLGQLVAGVAHEINNPVNFIYGNLTYTNQYAHDLLNLLHLYQKYYPEPDLEVDEYAKAIDLDFLKEDLPKILASMKIGSERIRNLVLSLRNFSRLDQAEMKPVDIHEGIDSTLLILQHRLKGKPNYPGITVVKTYSELPLVECYASQLNQVFMNVLSNAIDALEDYHISRTAEGMKVHQSQITISTRVKPVDLERIGDRNGENSPSSLPTSPHVVIEIADNGPGISPALLSKVFNPFFTTKPIGKGTGLGLSISYQIVVEKHGGSFRCDSQIGQGTQFRIEIPIQQPKPTPERPLLASEPVRG
ncbi:GAF domain-containing protein [Allocoleopsis franciscana]|uniref:histidine kinase n=1 Tax=Allocoleopsis franciscana PCC 7113 TaxID=1173027 RepID=K9WMG6_9CYAN|nr:GAF domain-containing protein [Allocoleopsis franciscana]AFZ20732.1 histidine kinase,histidine kinase,GAF domain-containing protein [Allocoleopsis franciscana PCC 7113]